MTSSNQDDITAQLRNLQRRVTDLERAGQTGGGQGEPLTFDSAGDFAEHWLLQHLERRATTGAGETAWCRTWWKHPEAVLRVEALWRSFEAARLDPFNGIATWIVTQLDPQITVLTSRRGPLGRCTTEACAGISRLPTEPIPDGHPAR
ncbi:DUF4913 domain-containing protein [Salsipaludibacter albus]|uniref:DUF4913 domain-containing protein n=1 Tax=Salsipaludibacter albus TaxID=2849650 RepID=UPI001EE48FB7|nr:DUF4913 domain-containing protein [Salsipaludibacter albus]MBY5163293.1 DUF4913 domain-containing protein [Salsipaludibacter albus]